MKEELIAQLLQRYMEAETTAEEEQLLRQYFKGGTFDARFAQYAPLFTACPHGDSALTLAECEDILALCPSTPRSTFGIPRQWWHYAAAWLFGIFLGGAGVWWSIARTAESGGSAPLQAMTVTDTVYHEHIVTRCDTVYIVKTKDVPTPQPVSTGGTRNTDGTKNGETKKETDPDFPQTLPDITWEESHNLASLVVR